MGSSDVTGSTEWTGVCRSAGKWPKFMGFLKRLLGKKNCPGTLVTGWTHERPDRSVPSFSLRGNGNAPQLRAPMSNNQKASFCYGCQQSCSTPARNAGQVKRKGALATIPISLVGWRIEPSLADLAQKSANPHRFSCSPSFTATVPERVPTKTQGPGASKRVYRHI